RGVRREWEVTTSPPRTATTFPPPRLLGGVTPSPPPPPRHASSPPAAAGFNPTPPLGRRRAAAPRLSLLGASRDPPLVTFRPTRARASSGGFGGSHRLPSRVLECRSVLGRGELADARRPTLHASGLRPGPGHPHPSYPHSP